MSIGITATRLTGIGTALLLVACSDQAATPTAVPDGDAQAGALAPVARSSSADALLAQVAEPFTFRAPLDPFRVHELPDFLMHSRTRSDLVIQRLVLAPGAGPWHTHPGPSFVIVAEGLIKLGLYVPGTGCIETPVYGPGETFFRDADEIHRPVIVSAESAVLYAVRLNVPPGAAITDPASPPC